MTLEQIRKLNLESPNTLNLEQNLINQLRVETDNLLDVFLKKYKGPVSYTHLTLPTNVAV